MENKELFSMLGLCRRAGKLSEGHDAVKKAVGTGRAKACLVCSDASDRLKREFQKSGAALFFAELPCTRAELWYAAGLRAAVLSINDTGLAERLGELLKREEKNDN